MESGSHTPKEISDREIIESFQDTDKAESNLLFNQYSICALSITTVIGGQYYGWNENLTDGFGTYAVGQGLMAMAYLIYVCCMAEIVSGFPFSGGGYGLARVAQGYWVGFLVGCCEALEYIAYSAMSFLYVSDVLCLLLRIDHNYALLFCVLCYAVSVVLAIYGERPLHYTNYLLAFLSLVILLLFCFGTMHWVNFDKYASLHASSSSSSMSNWFRGGMSSFLAVLPNTTAAYGGIEALCLLPSFTDNPRVSIPKGLLLGWLVLFVSNMLVMFVMSSMPGGIETTSTLEYPMEVGFRLMFNCTHYGTMILMLPAQFAMGYGFVLPYSKLLQSLGSTNLLPSVLRLNHCNDHHNAAIVGSIFGLVLCAICIYWTEDYLPHICMLAGFLTYLSQLHGYYMLKTKFTTITRAYTSPFGLAGVMYSSVVFLLGIVSILGFVDDYVTVAFVGSFLIVLSVYYHVFAARTQTIAKEEQAVLFQLHVAKGNKRKKHMKRHGHSQHLKSGSATPHIFSSRVAPFFDRKSSRGVSESKFSEASLYPPRESTSCAVHPAPVLETRGVENC